jgi:hypothetical protein
MKIQSTSGNTANTIPHLNFFPPQEKNGRRGDCGVIANPNRALEIGIGGMIGDIREFIQKAVRQKSQHRRQNERRAAARCPFKGFLNDDSGENVSRGSHEFDRSQSTPLRVGAQAKSG